MSGLRFLVLGVGDAFSARYYSSCFAVEFEGRWLLIDCPHPIRKMMRDASEQSGLRVDVPDLEAVVVSHLHADHSSGLEGLAFYRHFIVRKSMPLLTHAPVAEVVWQHHLAGGMEWSLKRVGTPPVQRTLSDFFDVMLLAENQPVSIGPFVVRCKPTVHSIPSIAMRIEAGGRSLGYSADTVFDPALVDWLAQADCIIHEAGVGFMHTPYASLANLPEAVRKKIHLIHYPDDFDLAASVMEPLRQGQLYQV
jgi:ribonuclease BN (tRNA processing enzyme)